jgi:signal transduction histidine kinase
MNDLDLMTPEKLLLTKAFKQFTDTSEKLEKQFLILSQEADNLKKKLKAKEEEVKRAERLATLGKTAAVVAHEVRNPLGALSLFLGLLTEDLKDKPSSMELIKEMEKSIMTIDHVVSNILLFTKEKELVKTPVNVQSVIWSALNQVFPRGAGDIKVTVDACDAPFIAGEEISLRQAFVNLFLNAAQAMHGKGELTVSIAKREDMMRVLIKDTGSGIAQDLLTKLFEPFVTSKKQGTGLGLAIVAQIIRQHKGVISAHNRTGGICGAEFVIEFDLKR